MSYQDMLSTLQETIREMPRPDLPVLLGELERLKALTWHRMMSDTQAPRNDRMQTLLTMKNVAAQLNIPVSCAYELTRQGRLRSIRVGVKNKYVRVTQEELEVYKNRINVLLPGG